MHGGLNKKKNNAKNSALFLLAFIIKHKMILKRFRIPYEIMTEILSYDNNYKLRNGELMKQIKHDDYRIKNIEPALKEKTFQLSQVVDDGMDRTRFLLIISIRKKPSIIITYRFRWMEREENLWFWTNWGPGPGENDIYGRYPRFARESHLP